MLELRQFLEVVQSRVTDMSIHEIEVLQVTHSSEVLQPYARDVGFE